MKIDLRKGCNRLLALNSLAVVFYVIWALLFGYSGQSAGKTLHQLFGGVFEGDFDFRTLWLWSPVWLSLIGYVLTGFLRR